MKYDGSSSDIWSCGIILYALLTGHLPFDDENIRQLLSKVKAGKFYMPADISPGARDLISRMLTVNPRRRITVRKSGIEDQGLLGADIAYLYSHRLHHLHLSIM